jgi:hypothetical protein
MIYKKQKSISEYKPNDSFQELDLQKRLGLQKMENISLK